MKQVNKSSNEPLAKEVCIFFFIRSGELVFMILSGADCV